MEILPSKLFSSIFKHLGPVDLIKCKRVCKLWYSLVDDQKVQELAIYFQNFEFPNWSKSNRFVNLDQTIKMDLIVSDLSIFENKLTNLKFLINLKRLKICSQIDGNSRFNILLTKFTELEQLDIDYPTFKSEQLNHPNLKIISINTDKKAHLHLEIDAPKLEILIYKGCIESVELTYPETLNQLHIDWCPLHNEIDLHLEKFENVESLSCNIPKANQNNLLSKLPKLKELNCYHVFDLRRPEDKNLVKRFITDLIEQKIKLKEKIVKIYFQDIELLGDKEYDDYGFDSEEDELFPLLENFNLLSTSRLDDLNYSVLSPRFVKEIKLLNSISLINGLPVDFFVKFINVNYVYTNKIEDQDHFKWFIKNCTNLKGIFMNRPSIDQNFFNSLPYLCQLNNLKILNDGRQMFNLDFILKFSNLITFETNEQFTRSIDLTVESFSTLKFLSSFRYKICQYEFIKIEKCHPRFYLKFHQMYDDGMPIRTLVERTDLSLDDLLKFFNDLKQGSIGEWLF